MINVCLFRSHDFYCCTFSCICHRLPNQVWKMNFHHLQIWQVDMEEREWLREKQVLLESLLCLYRKRYLQLGTIHQRSLVPKSVRCHTSVEHHTFLLGLAKENANRNREILYLYLLPHRHYANSTILAERHHTCLLPVHGQ